MTAMRSIRGGGFGLRSGACAALLAISPVGGVLAQTRSPVDTLSAKTVAESLAVLRELDRHLRANRTDHVGHHRRGKLAFVLSERARRENPPPGISHESLWRGAVTAMQQALRLAPDSARYLLDLGYFYQAQRDAASRATAVNYFAEAVATARRLGPRDVLTAALLEVGRNPPGGATLSAEARQSLGDTAFAEAWRLAPEDPRTFYHFARSLATRGAWKELAALARANIERDSAHAWSWLALGLALQRQLLTPDARAAFADGLPRLAEGERTRLFDVQRILRPSEVVRYRVADSAGRAGIERVAWLRDDPLWSRDDDDLQTEFNARVTQAQLTLGAPESGADGPSSLAGNGLIRYGPRVIASGPVPVPMDPMPLPWEVRVPDGFLTDDTRNDLFGSVRTEFGLPDGARTYPNRFLGEAVGPARPPTSVDAARAMIAGPPLQPPIGPGDGMTPEERAILRAERQPTSWTNAILATIDSLPVQAVRFRGGTDSVDLYLASQVQLDAMRASSAGNMRARGDFWLYGIDVPEAVRDSVDMFGAGALRWIRRLTPGHYLYRLEATADGVLRAARATAIVDLSSDPVNGFATRGFGVSDLWFASSAAPRGEPRRWRDFFVAPLLSPADSGGEVSLIWETYELARAGDAAHYSVTLDLRHADTTRSPAGRIAGRIGATIAAVLGASRDETDAGVSFWFDRQTRHTPVLVDHVTLQLGNTPPGMYLLTLTVVDRVVGTTTTRRARLAVGAPVR